MDTINCHKILYLYETPEEFYIQPVEHPNEALIINRQTFLISLNDAFSINQLPSNATSCLIYGVLGIKYIMGCHHLLIITEATQIGLVMGKPIFRLSRANILPFDHSIEERHDANHRMIEVYRSMMNDVIKTPHFYFSYEYDLTNSLQRNFEKKEHEFDQRFLWNGDMIGEFERFARYKLPLIHGFVSINQLESDSNWTLISRRSTKRAGTRFNRRGIDDDGNVANFVETEQILESGRDITSFVQIRGSIPVKWSQQADYRYKPAIKIDESNSHDSLSRHLNELVENYGRVSLVSLIDNRGHEGKLGHVFGQFMHQDHPQHPYHPFDFHAECAKMRWHRLAILMDRIEGEFKDYGFFAYSQGQIVQSQTGVIRSNCIDSLDRTNVVQSMIAGRVLKDQENLLRRTRPQLHDLDQRVFKNVWADNADILSIEYAGTPALKTDFTRTGKRTWTGQMRDGVNSLTRYYTNNFQDLYRQEAIDFFLGYHDGYPKSVNRFTAPTFFIGLILLTFVALYLLNARPYE